MVNNLILLSGNDIPFEEARLVLHPPTIKEIAYIGEECFWGGVEFLNFSKDLLSIEDKNNLSTKTDFEVLMSVIQSQSIPIKIHKDQMELVLMLLFPNYNIHFTPTSIAFQKDKEKNLSLIDSSNFNLFKELIQSIFCLEKLSGNTLKKYKPSNKAAEKIANKIKEGRKKLAKQRGEDDKGINILSSYVSILAVGIGADINTLMQYTVFQLIEEYLRYQTKLEFDMNINAKLAGVRNLKQAENWMKGFFAR